MTEFKGATLRYCAIKEIRVNVDPGQTVCIYDTSKGNHLTIKLNQNGDFWNVVSDFGLPVMNHSGMIDNDDAKEVN